MTNIGQQGYGTSDREQLNRRTDLSVMLLGK